jgi:hypothetical protein
MRTVTPAEDTDILLTTELMSHSNSTMPISPITRLTLSSQDLSAPPQEPIEEIEELRRSTVTWKEILTSRKIYDN